MEANSNLILKTNTAITTVNIDMYLRITPGSLLNLLIQSAISSADKLGFSFTNLKEHKMIWVLSRLTIEIYKPLNWYDVAEVETWPKDNTGIFYLRDFIVRNQKSEIVAKATSAWLAIDIDSRRPKVINDSKAELFTRLKDKYALNYEPLKLNSICSDDCYKKKAEYSDIDLNNHVTATRYIDWMMDSFTPQFHEQYFPQKISINYNKEILWSETVEVRKLQSKTVSKFEGVNLNSNSVSFRGMIEF